MYEYNCTIERVVDGDTIKVDIDLGFNVHIKEKIRLARINCPERGTAEGKKATEFMTKYVGMSAVVTTRKTDKYGRYIGEVTIGSDNLSDIIVAEGFGIYEKY